MGSTAFLLTADFFIYPLVSTSADGHPSAWFPVTDDADTTDRDPADRIHAQRARKRRPLESSDE
jgi:hypothetical protein